MGDMTPDPAPPPRLARATRGRWLGGVCAGLARARGLPVAAVRGAFALAALVAGVGVLAYLACWLIVPVEGEEDGGAGAGPPAIVTLVLAGTGALGLATLAALAAAATIFGFGWVVVAVAAVVLVAALASWTRLGPGWALLPVAALVLPSVAVAAAGVRVAPQSGSQRFAPASVAEIPTGGYRTGLGTLLVDLRHTALPRSGDVALRLDGGVRRTIVALPHDRCVETRIAYDVHSFAARAATVLLGRNDTVFDDVVLFGQHYQGRQGITDAGTQGAGPRLSITFTSAGGSLYVRDYPDAVDPEATPDWPPAVGIPAAPPHTAGMSKATKRRVIARWRTRHAAYLRVLRQAASDRRGPCAAKDGRA